MSSVLITSPSLESTTNVSGISSVVKNIIKLHGIQFIVFKVGKEDNQKRNIKWIINQFRLIIHTFRIIPKVDLIHINVAFDKLSLYRDTTIGFVGKLFNKKVIFHIHGGKYLMRIPSSLIVLFTIKILFKLADRTIVLSEIEKESINSIYKIDDSIVLPNAIDTEYVNKLKQKFCKEKLTSEVCNIVFLGRIHERKGLVDIIDAFKILNNKDLNYNFNMYGVGPRQDTYLKELGSLLGNKFYYGGIVGGDEKWKVLFESDIFILPSRYGEGLPMAMLEAMACECVVIVTDDASISTAVKHSINGIIINKNDPEDLAIWIEQLINSTNLRKQLAFAASTHINKHFSLDTYKNNILYIYNSILN